MKKITIIVLFIFYAQQVFTQEVCLPKEKSLIDINVLDENKCTISENKIPKVAPKDILMSSKRYLKKRIFLNQTVSAASNLKSNTISNVRAENKVSDKLLTVLINKSKEAGVSFDVVDKIPLFVSCEKTDLNKEDCFNYKMQQHIINNFNYPKAALKNNLEGNLNVSFVIDTAGKISKIDIEGANTSEILKKEARRIVLLLPKFIPGEHEGKKTSVSYRFPMNFTLD